MTDGARLNFGRKEWFLGGLLVASTLLAYGQVWHAGFIWDDDRHLTANPCIVGPGGLKEIWTTSAARICPLVLTTFWVEHAAWGLNPLPYHGVNVLMHAACGLALWRVLRILRIPGAWLGAALWTLHPVQVETVAWVTELKNTQSGLFYLLAIGGFLNWKTTEGDRPSLLGWSYGAALLLCGAAMASKSSTVILPVVLGLCAWWVDGRWRWRTAIGLLPVAALSAVASAWAMWTQNLEGANEPEWILTWPDRLVLAGRVVWFYLGKLVWPHPLVFIYPHWSLDSTRVVAYLPSLGVAALLAALWMGRKGRFRPAYFALAYFLTALAPVLGLVPHYFLRYSFVGDHLQYLASMGPLVLAGAALASAFDRFKGPAPIYSGAVAGALLLLLGVLTERRCPTFRDIKTLWVTTNAQNPDSWLVHNNLGDLLLAEGSVDSAIGQFQRVQALAPGFSGAYANLGIALLKKGRPDEAIEEFREALILSPFDPLTHNNLGNAYRRKGRMELAVAEFQTALKIEPSDAAALYNLGSVLLKMGRVHEAVLEFQRTVAIQPDNADAFFALGNALLQKGRTEEAIAAFRACLQVDPRNLKAHTNLGAALLKTGKLDEAVAQFQTVVKINPRRSRCPCEFGSALDGGGAAGRGHCPV